jgi:hypothetical protein
VIRRVNQRPAIEGLKRESSQDVWLNLERNTILGVSLNKSADGVVGLGAVEVTLGAEPVAGEGRLLRWRRGAG